MLTYVVLVAADWLSSANEVTVTIEVINRKTKAYHLAPLPTPARVMGLQLKPTDATTFWTGTPTAPKRNAPPAEPDL